MSDTLTSTQVNDIMSNVRNKLIRFTFSSTRTTKRYSKINQLNIKCFLLIARCEAAAFRIVVDTLKKWHIFVVVFNESLSHAFMCVKCFYIKCKWHAMHIIYQFSVIFFVFLFDGFFNWLFEFWIVVSSCVCVWNSIWYVWWRVCSQHLTSVL